MDDPIDTYLDIIGDRKEPIDISKILERRAKSKRFVKVLGAQGHPKRPLFSKQFTESLLDTWGRKKRPVGPSWATSTKSEEAVGVPLPISEAVWQVYRADDSDLQYPDDDVRDILQLVFRADPYAGAQRLWNNYPESVLKTRAGAFLAAIKVSPTPFASKLAVHPLGIAEPCRCIKMRCYQQAVARWFINKLNTGKGLLASLGTGVGKTLVGIDTAEMLRRQGLIDDVIVLTRSSLTDVFLDDIGVCHLSGGVNCPRGQHTIQTVKRKFPYYRVVTYDKIQNVARHLKDVKLENALLIIDEAHNLRGDSPGSDKRAIKRYKYAIDLARKVKYVLALTATPMIKNTQGLVYLACLIWKGSPPRDILEFKHQRWEEIYGNLEEGNAEWEKLARIFRGRVANCQPSLFQDDKRKCTSPESWPSSTKELVKVDLGTAKKTREIVDLSVTKGGKPKAAFAKLVAMSDNVKLIPDKSVSSYLLKINNRSAKPKCQAIVDRIKVAMDEGRYPICVYSMYQARALRNIMKALPQFRFKCLGRSPTMGNITSDRKRDKVVKSINQSLAPGEKPPFDILLLTPAYTEGITLCRFRELHIFEQQLDYGNLVQAMGRVVRYKTHASLPKEKQEVRIYEYVGTIPESIYKFDLSPEQYVRKVALGRETQRLVWERFLKKMSITMCPVQDPFVPDVGAITPRVAKAGFKTGLPPACPIQRFYKKRGAAEKAYHDVPKRYEITSTQIPDSIRAEQRACKAQQRMMMGYAAQAQRQHRRKAAALSSRIGALLERKRRKGERDRYDVGAPKIVDLDRLRDERDARWERRAKLRDTRDARRKRRTKLRDARDAPIEYDEEQEYDFGTPEIINLDGE